MEEAMQRFLDIKERVNSLSNKKIRVEERFKSEKEKLEKLLKEITEKGYDPKKLSEIRTEKEKQLEDGLSSMEKQIKEAEDKLNTIEV